MGLFDKLFRKKEKEEIEEVNVEKEINEVEIKEYIYF